MAALAYETVRAEYGALEVCKGRAGCESDAALVSETLPDVYELDDYIVERRVELLNELRGAATAPIAIWR